MRGIPCWGNARLGTCFDVNVVTDGPAPYTMYFSWRPKKAIALVRSTDGLSWTQEPEICLAADPTSGWEDDLNRSCTVFKDGVWHMWYTGQAKGWSRIGYATSTDGVHFTRVRKEPVLVPEHAYETPSTMNPYVRWDAARGIWRMWYAGGEQYEPNVLCYAESTDGLTWKKWAGNPFFTKGDEQSWDRDRVGACEVHPLPDGRWAMFYIGYSDIDTARIGCAISADGLTGWRRLPQNPIVAPDLGTWNASACYKPSVVRDEKNGRWLLWYNGRNGAPEYVGLAIHEGLDLETPARAPAETVSLLSDYVRRFNADDAELYTNAIPNAAAEAFLLRNLPRFACPDKDVERTYYFRGWTFRKHLRKALGHWTVTEFLPKVAWSGKDNTIVCPAGHHLREGRWLRDAQIAVDDARFWLSDPEATHRWDYASWLFTGARGIADVTGRDELPVELLDDAVRVYERWEKGFRFEGDQPMGGDGKGGFLSIDNHEGTEYSLGGNGYKPLFLSAQWSEAQAIAAVARQVGRHDLAARFDAKAEAVRQSLLENCWNADVGFFTTRPLGGPQGVVRELHGYAPWYFGVPTDGRRPDWAQLADPQGFAARFGLSFPERRAAGFAIDYRGHECKWNGPSWPFATTIALTALANDLHARSGSVTSDRDLFGFLMWQYAAQQKRTKDWRTEGDFRVVPWIDENLHPDKSEWISRKIILDTPALRDRFPQERGKDYNHSAFCDLVISGLVGLVPNGAKGFAVDPLCPRTWDYFVLENLRYRGHDVSLRWQRGEGLLVTVDGRQAAFRPTLGRVAVALASVGTAAIPSDAAAEAIPSRLPFAGARWIGQNPVPAFCPAATNQLGKVFRDLPKIEKNGARFRRLFRVPAGEVVSATLSVTGLGGYAVEVNGRDPQPQRMLSPSWGDPDSRVLYDVFDVRGLVKPGETNAVGICVSPGYSDDCADYAWRWTKPKRAIAALEIAFADGTRTRVVTDGAWEWTDFQPIAAASIYYGEVFEAARRDARWSCATGSVAAWRPVAVLADEGLSLARDFGPPVVRTEPLKPVRTWTLANGNRLFDFGVNRAGVVELRDRLPRGRRVVLRFAEETNEKGELDFRSHAGLRQQDVYVAAGDPDGESYCPRFTYHGFRYLEVEGAVEPDVTAWAVTAAIREKATFESSDETLNWLWSAACRSMRSNLVAYPTDCCNRWERTPCLMDSAVYEDAALQVYDIASYYRRWLYDAARYQDGFRLGEKGGNTNNPDWQGEAILLAERLLTYCAATNAAQAEYGRLKRTAEHFAEVAPDGLWTGWAFGDWCPSDIRAPFASVGVVNTALLTACYRAMARLAHVRGEAADARRFAALAEQAVAAFRKAFVGDAGVVAGGTQTDFYAALAFGLVPDDRLSRVREALARRIRETDGTHLTSGIFGTRYAGDVLLEQGLGDLWLEMMRQPTFPGFGYLKAQGATTLWEMWSPYGGALGMESHNHAMRAGAVSCFLTHLAGIRPLADGFRRIRIRPFCPAGLARVAATLEVPAGQVAVRWTRVGDAIRFVVTTPVPTEIHLPGRAPHAVSPGVHRFAVKE